MKNGKGMEQDDFEEGEILDSEVHLTFIPPLSKI
jgi:hypothetical protein